MKKIPTLFEREFKDHQIVGITDKVTPGCEWVLEGKGVATVKWDGACCAVINGVFYKRYDAKKGKTPPEGAIPCCDPDPITGHHPHWVRVNRDNPADKWLQYAYLHALVDLDELLLGDGTYEAIGPHFQGNPYELEHDTLRPHGEDICNDCPRTFEGIRNYLRENEIEGIVFWKDGEPGCKII